MKTDSLLLRNSIELLLNMYDHRNYIFASSTRLENGKYVNFYDNKVLRYSINSYLGLMKFNKIFNENILINEFDNFVRSNINKITNIGDKGLLLYTLSLSQHEQSNKLVTEIEKMDRESLLKCNLQEICWLLLGLVKFYEYYKKDHVIKKIEELFRLIVKNFFIKDSLFPKHYANKGLRTRFVSFGAIVYFLKSLYEYGNLFNDNYAMIIFKELTSRVIDAQGKDGAWGWFYNNKIAKVVDWFPIYSVHQDSMAMLFLFPAIKLGMEKARYAVIKSINWLFGDNFYKIKMINDNPFFIYRSLVRKHIINEKFERFIRAKYNSILNINDKYPSLNLIKINKECRSYHIGWILYAWSDEYNFRDFHNLKK